MSLLDDRRLRANLERRSEATDVPSSLADAVQALIQQTRQYRAWLPIRGDWRPRWAVVLTAVAALAIVGFAGLRVLPPAAGPEATFAPLQRFTAAGIVGSLNQPGLAGLIVVVDTDVELAAIPCPPTMDPARDCPIGFVVGTGNHVVLPDSAPVYEPDEVSSVPPPGELLEGPLAVRLRGDGAVELVRPLETRLGHQVVWPIDAMLEHVNGMPSLAAGGEDGVLAGPVFVVDAWLVEVAIAPSCPAPAGAAAPAVLPFTCGPVAWLTPEEDQPNVIESHGNGTGFSSVTPSGSLRVQNAAYARFAPDPVREGPWGVPQPRRAYYLVRPVLAFPEGDCFACSETREAYVIGRIDPIELPGTSPSTAD